MNAILARLKVAGVRRFLAVVTCSVSGGKRRQPIKIDQALPISMPEAGSGEPP